MAYRKQYKPKMYNGGYLGGPGEPDSLQTNQPTFNPNFQFNLEPMPEKPIEVPEVIRRDRQLDSIYTQPPKDFTPKYNFPTTWQFAYGGMITPNYEAEKDEVVVGGLPKVFAGGDITKNSDTTAKINGQTHEQGGVDMAGGERIFSDRLKVDSNFLKGLDI